MDTSLGAVSGMDNCLTAKLIGSELPTTMKAGDLTEKKELLQEVEVPVPSPKAGQVLVQVAGSAFNPVDWKLLESVLLWQTRNVGPGPVAPRNMPVIDTCRPSARHQHLPHRRLCCACLRFRVNLYSNCGAQGSSPAGALKEVRVPMPMPSPLTSLIAP